MVTKPTSPGGCLLPREVVLASAGTGKTFTLSTRLINLLARGAAPDSLLASTFTRKAAGEILTRVLSRLAGATLDPEKAQILANEVGLPDSPSGEVLGHQQTFSALLRALIRELHRANVGTLDSFFIRLAGSFPGDLGIPPGWSIGDEPTSQRLESEALQELLSGAKPQEMVELVRMTMRGESGRGVHQRLLAQLKELRGLLHQQGLSHPDSVWHPPKPADFGRAGDTEDTILWEEIFHDLVSAPLPELARGGPDTRFEQAIREGVEALRRRDWTGFCGRGLASKILDGEDSYHRKPIPTPVVQAFHRALAGVAQTLRGELAAQARALRALVMGFDGALAAIHRREGAYRFEDITFLLAGEDPLTNRTDLWYRLDQKAHHLLLDEFQDTSRAQWEALEPVASEILSGHPEDRSALIVADPKQSIYGWRGAEPSLARRVGARFGMDFRSLDVSYRSSLPVLTLVNRVFEGLVNNPVWESEPDLLEGVRDWVEGFPLHRPASELPGYVSLEAGPRDVEMGRSDRPAHMAWAAARIRDLHKQTPGATMGVLVRRNATVSHLMAHLRSLGVGASEEGATTLTDSPAVSGFLALLRLADHPGDRIARYQVALSPLGAMVGLTTYQDTAQARQVAITLRRELLTRGYGAVLSQWVQELRDRGSLRGREVVRLNQLVELGFRWDGRVTLRPRDFVRFVHHETMEAPSAARVRVMTVHKAKGLEFDVVVLPELDIRLTRGQGLYQAVLPIRDPENGEVLRIFPSLNKALRPLFPEVETAARQDRARELHDALGVVYVALTRARYALHLLTTADPPDGNSRAPFTFAGIVRGALGLDQKLAEEGASLFEIGSSEWAASVPHLQRPPAEDMDPPLGTESSLDGRTPTEGSPHPKAGVPEREPYLEARVPMEGKHHPELSPGEFPSPKKEGRSRFLPHRSPSGLKEGGNRALMRVLSLSGKRNRRVGTILHAWLETLLWMEDWDPAPADLHAAGMEVAPDLSLQESEGLQATLMAWLAQEEIGARLRQDAYPAGSEVFTELPFACKLQGSLYQGRIDRVVLIPEEGRFARAEVLDYKTDQIAADDAEGLTTASREYQGQLGVYQGAVAALFGIPEAEVKKTLVFLALGRLRGPED